MQNGAPAEREKAVVRLRAVALLPLDQPAVSARSRGREGSPTRRTSMFKNNASMGSLGGVGDGDVDNGEVAHPGEHTVDKRGADSSADSQITMGSCVRRAVWRTVALRWRRRRVAAAPR